MPVERLQGAWQHPARLPLGGGWRGHCTAPGHEGERPEEQILESLCNLGYADECRWSPKERAWDALRFAVAVSPVTDQQVQAARSGSAVPARILRLHYVCERNHLPVEHGDLEYDLARTIWLRRHDDPRLQKMAECFLDSYLKKKP
jgi:hypothetical protein